MTTSAPPQRPPTAPPRYKLAIVTWAASYPTITILLAAFKPLGLMALPLPLRTLLLMAIVVPTMGFVLVPSISRITRSWLRRPQTAAQPNASG
jgi:antibiotic biosynthesis monooxygenase (ABM) superfamily enzyme